MLSSEALRHERSKKHGESRRNSVKLELVEERGGSKDMERWDGKAGLEALENRKFEGSMGTMKTRVTSWMRGMELAVAGKDGRNGHGWRMEEDYRVEEHPPLEDWSIGWAETWARSSFGSGTGTENGSCEPDVEVDDGQGRFKGELYCGQHC